MNSIKGEQLAGKDYCDYLWSLYREARCVRCGRDIGYMHEKGISPPILCTDLNGNFGCSDLSK